MELTTGLCPQEWYPGEVIAFDPRSGRHLVEYDDNECEDVYLEGERFDWLPEPGYKAEAYKQDGRSVPVRAATASTTTPTPSGAAPSTASGGAKRKSLGGEDAEGAAAAGASPGGTAAAAAAPPPPPPEDPFKAS